MSENSFILSGPDNKYNITDDSVGKHFIEFLRKRNKDDPINIDPATKRVQTCQNVLDDTTKTVKLLKDLGVQKGDVISIISENIIGYNVPCVAAFCMGVAVNPLNPDYMIDEIRYALLMSKPKVIFCSTTAIQNVKILKEELEFIETIFVLGPSDSIDDSVIHFESRLNGLSVEQNELAFDNFNLSETVALILLSSGTTGLPKGVMLTHKNIRIIMEIARDPECVGMADGDITIAVLPFFHAYGFVMYLMTMFIQVTAVVLNKFKPDIFLSTIQEYKVNKLHLVPPIVVFLAKHPSVANYDLSSVEDILVGAAAIGNEMQDEVIKRLGKINFRQVYGSTETSGPSTILPCRSEKGNTVGKVSPYLQAKVLDITSGKIVGCGEPGEMCFKGPIIMKGYVGVANNDSIIDKDGFYHSGDIGYYDEDGYFYIVDRLKELIKYKGFQVAPAELETLLLTHPAVKDCGVIGKPDERAGQLPFAFVVLQANVSVTEQDLIDYVAARISTNKRLYGGVRFVNEIPKNAAGKILRKKLEETLKNDCIS